MKEINDIFNPIMIEAHYRDASMHDHLSHPFRIVQETTFLKKVFALQLFPISIHRLLERMCFYYSILDIY